MSTSVRRSPFLVTYWEGSTQWVYSYSSGRKLVCAGWVPAILAGSSHWTSRDALRHAANAVGSTDFDQAVDTLLRDGLLDLYDRQPPVSDLALKKWDVWSPAAAFFHSVTRSFRPSRLESNGHRELFLRPFPFPPSLKDYPGESRLELPAFAAPTELAEVLRSRRTWRDFGPRDLTVDEIATLLGVTFGVQRWLEVGDDQWVPLKTSPSGGARHSIEAYLLAFRIDGLDAGTYHYCPDRHALLRLDAVTSSELLNEILPAQPGFRDAPAVLIMTSVFARMQWKYPDPHAYRVVLLDAGHLSQTFALLATAMGLAPFCTAAIDSIKIEQQLGIDGISEAPVLVLGVGSRPAGKSWALRHDRSENPNTAPPAWAARFDPAP